MLAGLRGDRSVRDVCREHQISEALYCQWRDRLLEAGWDAPDSRPTHSTRRRRIVRRQRAAPHRRSGHGAHTTWPWCWPRVRQGSCRAPQASPVVSRSAKTTTTSSRAPGPRPIPVRRRDGSPPRSHHRRYG
ncbi:MAG: transposase [Ilumatobacteraceae bacterium]